MTKVTLTATALVLAAGAAFATPNATNPIFVTYGTPNVSGAPENGAGYVDANNVSIAQDTGLRQKDANDRPVKGG